MAEPEIEERAKAQGWRPREEFRGNQDNFVDAQEFLDRSRQMVPILKERYEKLEAANRTLTERLNASERAVQNSQEAIAELRKFNTEIARERAKATEAALKRQLVEAKTSGNVEQEVELTDQLAAHREAVREAPKGGGEARPEAPAPDAEAREYARAAQEGFAKWRAENPWYGADEIKTAVADRMAQKLRAEGSELKGREFFDAAAARADAELAKISGAPPRRGDKVEGGARSTGGGSGGSGSGAKGYGDLPAEVKEAAERFLKRDIKVGKGRNFETAEAYRADYARKYFEKEG